MRAVITVQINSADGTYPSDEAVRTRFADVGLQPRSLAATSDSETGIPKEYFQTQAQHILDRIPDHTAEQKLRKELERESVIYASHLTRSGADFMVSRRTDGALLLRLLQDRLTKLFEACEDLAQRIDSSVLHADERSRQHREPQFALRVDDEISIYEHGLEEATISGAVVRNKWKYLWKHNSLDVVVFLVFLFLFLSATLAASGNVTDHPKLVSFFERLETGAAVTAGVAFLSLANIYTRLVPTIDWSLERRDRRLTRR